MATGVGFAKSVGQFVSIEGTTRYRSRLKAGTTEK